MGTRRSRHNKGRKRRSFRDLSSAEANLGECSRCGGPRYSNIGGGVCKNCYTRGSAFLSSGAAKSLTVDYVEGLAEDQARGLFQQIRWHDSDGQPRCPDCDGKDLYVINRAQAAKWRCKMCDRDFSVTTGTPFRSRKLPFKAILITIALLSSKNGNQRAQVLSNVAGYGTRSAISLKQRVAGMHLRGGPLNIELGKSRYIGDAWHSTRTWWTEPEKAALVGFVEKNVDVVAAANALGRSPESIVNYAKDRGLAPSYSWRSILPSFVAKKKLVGPAPAPLQFPYIQKPRAEHADLLAVNELVPKGLPSFVRADIVQEIMLAILERRTSVEALRATAPPARWYVAQFYKNNYEQGGHAVSLTGLDDDDRTYDEIASSIAAREWRYNEMNERRRSFDALTRTFYAPTQLDDTYESQVRAIQFKHHVKNDLLSFEEAEAAIAAAE